MTKRKVLFVAHNHPSKHPGGAQQIAYELFKAFNSSADFEPRLLARADDPSSLSRPEGRIVPREAHAGEFWLFTNTTDETYNWVRESSRNKALYTETIADFLLAEKPDIVHLQHTTEIGFDVVRLIRTVLPGVPIVYTLHDFIPICLHRGQMVRTFDGSLCDRASPTRCNECFPAVTPEAFFLREQFIKKSLGLVDLFLAPSRFLRDRFIDWGIPPGKILYEEFGRDLPEPTASTARDGARNRFAYFGQLTPSKGLGVLLEAMKLVATDANAGSPHLTIHGANLEAQESAFRNRFSELTGGMSEELRHYGAYSIAELPELMANVDWVVVPSTWWENSPLVIQEAFFYGRPVICSDIGGMAEKVTDGVNGLHFEVGNAQSLAQAIIRAVGTPGLWDRLHGHLPALRTMAEATGSMSAIYSRLLTARLSPTEATKEPNLNWDEPTPSNTL